LRIGYFGASTGGGAALVAAARLGQGISAVVFRGGRPDLAEALLPPAARRQRRGRARMPGRMYHWPGPGDCRPGGLLPGVPPAARRPGGDGPPRPGLGPTPARGRSQGGCRGTVRLPGHGAHTTRPQV
jgi:pimeloyl-ACP methyl ester carboxylesterase